MTTIEWRLSRAHLPSRSTTRRHAAAALLCAAGWLAAVASNGIEPTAAPDGAEIASTAARGGVSQMAVMKANR